MYKKAFLCCVAVLTLVTSIASYAIPATFSNSVIIEDADFTDLPDQFTGRDRASSIALIQRFLENSRSTMATKNIVLDVPTDWGSPAGKWLTDRPYLAPYVGRVVPFSEAVWMVSQEDLGKGRYYSENTFSKVNPVYLLALIQKESGLIFGNCASTTCYGQSLEFRIDRMTGYACFEGNPDCDPEFRGPFRQMYFGLRDKKAFADGCRQGFDVWNGGRMINFLGSRTINYKVGNTITIDGKPILLQTAIACSSYFYTPHDTYFGFYSIMKGLDQSLRNLSLQVPLGNPTQPPPSSPSSSSTQPPPPSLPDTFTGVQNQQQAPIREAIQQVDAPKPPPAPVYVPLYIERDVETNQTSNQHVDDFVQAMFQGRSVPTESSSSILGVQEDRTPWYLSPFFVISAAFVIVQTAVLAVYWFLRQLRS